MTQQETTWKPLLLAVNGSLHFPSGGINWSTEPPVFDCPLTPSMLIRHYDAGDCDVVPWPWPVDRRPELARRLASALYDERECNKYFPWAASVVVLPDGTEFNIENNLE